MKTYSPKPEHIQRRWYVLDAGGQVLGRIATEAAHILRGKHKPIYAPHADVGDHVIIVNASKVVLTGGKEQKKVAYRHSGHPGGINATLYEDLLRRRPAFAVEKAVRGMLPKNRLGRAMIKKLHVEPGPEHPHRAQQPESWAMGQRPVWDGLPAPVAAPETPPRAARQEAKPTKSARARTTTTATTAPATRTAARGSTATKTSARRTTADKTTARKSTAAKTTSRKSTSRKSTSKKTTARKPAASKKKET